MLEVFHTLVRDLNSPSESPEYNLIRSHVGMVATRPSRYTESPPYKCRALLQPLHSPEAHYESERAMLDLLVGDINDALGSNLRLQFGTETYRQYSNPTGAFPLPSGQAFDEMLEGLEGIGVVANDDYLSHIKKSRGVIKKGSEKEPRKFMVVGDLPDMPRRSSLAKHLAWSLGKLLQSSQFNRLRQCRRDKCEKFFFADDRRRAVCPHCRFDDSTVVRRNREKRERVKEAAEEKARTAQRIRLEQADAEVFKRCFLEPIKNAKHYLTDQGKFVNGLLGKGTDKKLDLRYTADTTSAPKIWQGFTDRQREEFRDSKYWKSG